MCHVLLTIELQLVNQIDFGIVHLVLILAVDFQMIAQHHDDVLLHITTEVVLHIVRLYEVRQVHVAQRLEHRHVMTVLGVLHLFRIEVVVMMFVHLQHIYHVLVVWW